MTRALGTAEEQTTSYERDATSHALTSTTDELERETTYGYDSLGNLTSVTRLAGTAEAATTEMTYEPDFNQLASVTDPLEHTTSFAYDALGRLETVTEPTGKETTLTSNKRGQPLSVTDPLEHTTEFGYELGDLASTTDALGRTTTRFVDAGGRLLAFTDPLGNKTAYAYDDLNAPTNTTDPLGNETSFDYDRNGNVLSLTDARGHETTYTYDDLDRVETRTDPLLREESYGYDEAGNLETLTDRRGQVTRYRYDALGRRTFAGFDETGAPGSETYESTIDYGYDDGDRLTSADDSDAGTITLAYDGLDRPTSETTPQGSVAYTYDGAGRRTSMTVAGEDAVTYDYDDADRLTGITQDAASVGLAYDDAGRLSTTTLPNGIIEGYAYDDASQLTGITYALGETTLGDLAYGYDLGGRRTGVTGSWARTDIPEAMTSASYDDANELTSWDGTSLSFDADGNLTGDGTNTFSWNARGELTDISGSTNATFAYDAFGRRVEKTDAGTTTGFLYDGANAVQQQDGGGSPTADLLTGLGLDQTFARSEGGATQSLLTDALGSIVALTDGTGAVQTSYTYAPFGETTASGSASANASQFTGREHDINGLYYYRARYYDPTTQRFLSQDPLGLGSGDSNQYAYVGNAPTNMVDPLGLCGFNLGGLLDVVRGRCGNPLDFVKKNWKTCLWGAAAGSLEGPGGMILGCATSIAIDYGTHSSNRYVRYISHVADVALTVRDIRNLRNRIRDLRDLWQELHQPSETWVITCTVVVIYRCG
jgi:RHS repeat-associated protein